MKPNLTEVPIEEAASPAPIKNNSSEEEFPFFKPVAQHGPAFHPYEKLVDTALNKRYWMDHNIDSAQREKYLSDEEFQKLFGLSKKSFEELKPFKKRDLKVKLKLF